jgi:hypothetical protein
MYSLSSYNEEYNFNDNEPILSSGFPISALYSAQYYGSQKESYTDANFEKASEEGSTSRPTVDESYTDANFEKAFEEGSTSRPTASSLGWTMNSPNVRLYSFRVRKGKEPYFELKSPFAPTSETPGKIYLDHAKYVLLKCHCVRIC